MSDLREDLVRAAGDVSVAADLVASASTLGQQRLRRRRRVTRGAAAVGLVVVVVGTVWAGSEQSTGRLHVVPAESPSVSASISPHRQAAAETLDAAVDETFPGWSSTPTALAGSSIDQQAAHNGWFTVRRGDADPVEVRVTVQNLPGSDFPHCSDCTISTREDGSRLGVGRYTGFVSSNEMGGSTIERPWADLLTADGRLISAEATPVDTPEEPLPDGVAFPAGSPVTEDALAALVQLPALQQLDLTE